MKHLACAILIIVAACGLAMSALAQAAPEPAQPAKARIAADAVRIEAADAVRFVPIEVHVDPAGSPLAAWQFDLTCDDPAVRIAGIENSDHPAFDTPPYYDPAAMRSNRVIAASFNTAAPDALPAGKLRVATVMVMIPAGSTPTFSLKLAAAADPAGRPIPHATATILEGTTR